MLVPTLLLLVLTVILLCATSLDLRDRLKGSASMLKEINAMNVRIDGMRTIADIAERQVDGQIKGIDTVVASLCRDMRVLKCPGHEMKVTGVDKNKYRTVTMPRGARQEVTCGEHPKSCWVVTLKCSCGYTETRTYSDLTVKLRSAVDNVDWSK